MRGFPGYLVSVIDSNKIIAVFNSLKYSMSCGVGILPAQLMGPRRLSHRNLTVLNSSGNRYSLSRTAIRKARRTGLFVNSVVGCSMGLESSGGERHRYDL